jgi:hypothetical protein
MPLVRLATEADAHALALDLRLEDEAEIRAMSGQKPLGALLHGIRFSDVPLAIQDDDGSTIGLFGVVTTQQKPRVGAVWLLASPKLLKYSRRLARESRRWVETLQAQYDVLFNLVDERNTLHIRWIQWCSFTFVNRHPALGAEQRPFLEFVRIKKSHV